MAKVNCFYISHCSETMKKYHSSFKSTDKQDLQHKLKKPRNSRFPASYNEKWYCFPIFPAKTIKIAFFPANPAIATTLSKDHLYVVCCAI